MIAIGWVKSSVRAAPCTIVSGSAGRRPDRRRALGGAGEQGAGVHQHHGVVVDVDDLGVRSHPLGDLVGVVGGGQAGADVQELTDARLTGQVPDRADQEGPRGASVLDDRRERLENLVADLAVDVEVVFAAQPVVPDPGRLGHVGVDLGRDLAGGGRVVCHGMPHLPLVVRGR